MCLICYSTIYILPSTAAPPNLPPSLTTSPQDMQAIRTETVTFICTAIAVPIASITWDRDNSSISSGGRYNISTVSGVMVGNNLFQTSSILTLSDVQKEDEGAYSCTASNNEGIVTGTGMLTVRGKLECA